MGINGLLSFIKKKYPKCVKYGHVANFAYGKRVVFDVSAFVFKYKITHSEKWLKGFIHLISFLKDYNIHPTFIFDGTPPKEKENERKRRTEHKEKHNNRAKLLEDAIETYKSTGEKEKILIDVAKRMERKNKSMMHKKIESPSKDEIKINIKALEKRVENMNLQGVNITPEDFTLLKTQIFDILKIPFETSSCEAESLCVKLCKDGFADLVITEDSDVLAYGAPMAIFKFSTVIKEPAGKEKKSSGPEIIVLEELLEEMDLTFEQFQNFCILCGTDYNDNIPGIGPAKALDLIRKYETIENLIKNYGKNEGKKGKKKQLDFKNVENYKRILDIFNQVDPNPQFLVKSVEELNGENVTYTNSKLPLFPEFTEEEIKTMTDKLEEEGIETKNLYKSLTREKSLMKIEFIEEK